MLSLRLTITIYPEDLYPILRPYSTAEICRDVPTSQSVPKSGTRQLRIEETSLDEEQASNIGDRLSFFIPRGYTQAFKVVFQETERILPWVLPIQGSDAARIVERYGGSACLYSYALLSGAGAKRPPPIGCQPLGPGLLSDKEIVRFWNAIALTDDEDRAMEALRLILGSDLERVAVIRDDEPSTYHIRTI